MDNQTLLTMANAMVRAMFNLTPDDQVVIHLKGSSEEKGKPKLYHIEASYLNEDEASPLGEAELTTVSFSIEYPAISKKRVFVQSQPS